MYFLIIEHLKSSPKSLVYHVIVSACKLSIEMSPHQTCHIYTYTTRDTATEMCSYANTMQLQCAEGVVLKIALVKIVRVTTVPHVELAFLIVATLSHLHQ